jgi:hypothetical protein
MQSLRSKWKAWREDMRQQKLDRALYKARGGEPGGPSVHQQEMPGRETFDRRNFTGGGGGG